MPIIRSSRLWCWLPHWSFRSWFDVGWRLGAGRLEWCPGCRLFRPAGYSLQPGHHSSLPAPNLQPTANQERNDQCGNQHHSREFLMMGIVMPETFWAHKKWNKIASNIKLVFLFFSYHNDARSNKHRILNSHSLSISFSSILSTLLPPFYPSSQVYRLPYPVSTFIFFSCFAQTFQLCVRT